MNILRGALTALWLGLAVAVGLARSRGEIADTAAAVLGLVLGLLAACSLLLQSREDEVRETSEIARVYLYFLNTRPWWTRAQAREATAEICRCSIVRVGEALKSFADEDQDYDYEQEAGK